MNGTILLIIVSIFKTKILDNFEHFKLFSPVTKIAGDNENSIRIIKIFSQIVSKLKF